MAWFVWNGQDSRDFNIWISNLPQPTRAAERTAEVQILGRAGTLLIKEGDDVHESYLKECEITVPYTADFQSILEWLSGDGTVIFSNEPDFVYHASIPNELKFTRQGNSLRVATIPFFVQPHKGRVPPETTIAMTADGTVTNPGTVAARPMIHVTFTERCTVEINDAEMKLVYPFFPTLTIATLDATSGDPVSYEDGGTVTTPHVQIKDSDSNVVEEWDSDAETGLYTLANLPDGTYTVHETVTPTGWATPSDVTFTVLDGCLQLTPSTIKIDEDGVMIFQHDASTQSWTVSNTPDPVTADVDCDAQIVTEDGAIWTGAANGVFPLLPPGASTVDLTDCTISIEPRWRWF